jgi:replicative DNA helicase
MNEETKSDDIKNPKDSASIWNSKSKPNLSLTIQDLEEIRQGILEPFMPSLVSLYEIWGSLKSDIMSRTEKPQYPIGLKSLDEILWGIHKKEMMVIGARTSQGKSAFSIFLAKNLADLGKRVIYFSLEMSKEQILERILTQLCLINNLDLRHGQAKEEVLKKEKMFQDWIDNAKLLIDDKYGYDFNKLVRIVELIKPDFVFVDYIQMISTKGFKSKLDAIEEYIRRIKELSVDNNFGSIVISQINRTGVNEAEMQHLKGAGVLEEHADTVCFLKWDWSLQDPSKFVVDIKKQRHGETKSGVMLNFIPQHSLFSEKEFLNVKKELYQ